MKSRRNSRPSSTLQWSKTAMEALPVKLVALLPSPSLGVRAVRKKSFVREAGHGSSPRDCGLHLLLSPPRLRLAQHSCFSSVHPCCRTAPTTAIYHSEPIVATMMNLRSAGILWKRQSCGGRAIHLQGRSCSSSTILVSYPQSREHPAQQSTRNRVICNQNLRFLSTSPSDRQQQQQSTSFYSTEQKQAMDQCKKLHASIMELNERVSGSKAV